MGLLREVGPPGRHVRGGEWLRERQRPRGDHLRLEAGRRLGAAGGADGPRALQARRPTLLPDPVDELNLSGWNKNWIKK